MCNTSTTHLNQRIASRKFLSGRYEHNPIIVSYSTGQHRGADFSVEIFISYAYNGNGIAAPWSPYSIVRRLKILNKNAELGAHVNFFSNKYARLLSQVFVHLRRIWRVVKPVRPLLALDTWMGQRKSGFGTAVLWKQSRSFSHSHSQ